MQNNHLQELLKENRVVAEDFKSLRKQYSIEPLYFWDESKIGHIGAGWLVEYIIIVLSIGAGIAAGSFLKGYFSKAGEDSWRATLSFFKRFGSNYNREKMFFFLKVGFKNSNVIILLDNNSINSKRIIKDAYLLSCSLLQLIESDDHFIKDDFSGTNILKYDIRCKDIMIYPAFTLDITNPEISPIISYSWLLDDKPDPKYSCYTVDNLLSIRGMFHQSLQQYDQAQKYLKRALKINPHEPRYNLHLANSYFHKGKFKKAIKFWRKAIAFSEKKEGYYVSSSFFNIACVESMRVKIDSAVEAIRNAIKAGVDISSIENNPYLEELRKDSRFEDIMRDIKRHTKDKDHTDDK